MTERTLTDPTDIQRILEERARALATPVETDELSDAVEMIVVVVGSELYVIDSRFVLEVLGSSPVARVPGLPNIWRGIVNVRGTLFPVLDLHRFLGLAEREEEAHAGRLVLVSGAGFAVGLIVEDVTGVRLVPDADINPPLAGAPGGAPGFTRGITRDLFTILDIRALLADPRLTVREERS